MAIKYDEIYKDLICEDVPRKRLKSVENHNDNQIKKIDPWIGEKPHAEDGFVVNYCLEY